MPLTDFQKKVYKICSKIPCGKVSTYNQIAKKTGQAGAYRAVGNTLNKNFDKNVPCHRVVRADGFIGGYNKGRFFKIKILQKEGVKIQKNKVNLAKYFYRF